VNHLDPSGHGKAENMQSAKGIADPVHPVTISSPFNGRLVQTVHGVKGSAQTDT
jgi:hypothetical protein